MSIPFHAGRIGASFLEKLYKGKSFMGKKTGDAVKHLSAKGHTKTAKYTNLAAQNVNKGIKYADKTIRKYPKSASAVGGAIAFDIFDDE
jgi:hypothetical protein